MSTYKGNYPYDEKLKKGELRTHPVYDLLNRPWVAAFHYDKQEIPGEVTVCIVEEADRLLTEPEALELAKTRGFVLQSKEGE